MKKLHFFILFFSLLFNWTLCGMQNENLKALILKNMSALYADYQQEDITLNALEHFQPTQSRPMQAIQAFKLYMAGNPIEKTVVTDAALTSRLADAELEYGSYFDVSQNKNVRMAELLSIHVAPKAQKIGLGSMLLQYSLSAAKKRHLDFVHLNAKPFNIPQDKSYAQALQELESFYERNGGVVTNYNEDTTDFCFNLSPAEQ